MRPAAWKVGELAKRTGLSVRTLHHYEEIGLLSPSSRTEAGHRLYATDDIVRLQQIKSLCHMAFFLEGNSGLPGQSGFLAAACDPTPHHTPEGADRVAAQAL
jgi:hypothetical protein